MKLVDNIFKKYILDETKLLPYGFTKIGNLYSFTKSIHKNKFELKVLIENGIISARLMDKEFNDEFIQINVESATGGFIASLKDECSEALLDIRNNCYKEEYFIYPQTNRITKLIKDRYDVSPEFPWDKDPGCGVFRNKRNDKWFGIIMNIPKKKLDKITDTEVEVLNIKLDELTDEYLGKDGFYVCYHMNKKKWISIILDDTLSDDLIMELIGISVSKTDESKYYIVPANPLYYDIMHAFDNKNIIEWKQGNGIKNNDIIFMYVASPISKIVFMCEVIETDIPYEYISKELTIKKLMRIKLLKRYKTDEFTFDNLKNKYGVTFIRGPRPVPKELEKKLLELE